MGAAAAAAAVAVPRLPAMAPPCPKLGCNLRGKAVQERGHQLWFLQETIAEYAARTRGGSGLLPLLDGFRRAVCLFRFMRCYDKGDYVEARHKVCDHIEATAIRLGLHGNGSDMLMVLETACLDPWRIPKALEAVFQALPPAASASETGDGLSPAIRALAQHAGQGASPNSSSWVINLGAGPNAHDLGRCGEDSANCLVFGRGWRGVLFEGDSERAAKLRSAAWSRADVFVMANFARPKDFAGRALDAVFALDRGAFQRAEAGELFPDFLKIDVDNGDCDFLEEGVATLRPKFVEIEILQSFLPPPIRYRQRFNGLAVNYSGLYHVSAEQVFARGCSLAAAAALLPEHELVEFDGNARFLHRSQLEELGLPPLNPALAWQHFMAEEWERLVLTRLGYSMFSFDLDYFRVGTLKEKMQLLEDHFQIYGAHERWELSTDP